MRNILNIKGHGNMSNYDYDQLEKIFNDISMKIYRETRQSVEKKISETKEIPPEFHGFIELHIGLGFAAGVLAENTPKDPMIFYNYMPTLAKLYQDFLKQITDKKGIVIDWNLLRDEKGEYTQ